MTRPLALALSVALALSACASDTDADSAGPSAASTGQMDADTTAADSTDADAAVTPPAAVAAAFAAAQPAATETEWSMEGEQFEAAFMNGETHMSTLYDADGTAGAVETRIGASALPAPISAALARDYADAEVLDAERIVNAGTTTYEAEIRRNGEMQDVLFTADGTVVPPAGD